MAWVQSLAWELSHAITAVKKREEKEKEKRIYTEQYLSEEWSTVEVEYQISNKIFSNSLIITFDTFSYILFYISLCLSLGFAIMMV